MAAKLNPIQSNASTSAAPLDALDVINVEEVSDVGWRAVFDTIGYPPGMTAGSFSKEALLDHLAGEEVSDPTT